MKLQNMKRGETTEQITLFNWAENNKHILPCLSLMYHIPNEGKRTNGAVLKAMGLKSGVPDVCLPVPSHNFNGLYLEMKYGQNKPTKDQEAFMAALRQQGYKTAVCYGADEAVTCKCECDAAKKYAESKERVQKAKSRITELFGNTAERPIDQDVVTVMLNVVDAIEAKHMKGITIDVGQGVKAKVSKMAKESIKVERSETSKKIYEE